MQKTYEEFIEETKKECPELFESMGEAYFKEMYDTRVKIDQDYKKFKEIFTVTLPSGGLGNLNEVDESDNTALLKVAFNIGDKLKAMANLADALYVNPLIAAFLQLIPTLKRPKTVQAIGIYKFGELEEGDYKIECYKAPNEVAQEDYVLLHTRNNTWKKFKIEGLKYFYERKEKAREKERPKFENDFGGESLGEVTITMGNLKIRKAINEVLEFMKKKSEECDKSDIDSMVAWDTLWNDFYEEFSCSERYNNWGRNPIYKESKDRNG